MSQDGPPPYSINLNLAPGQSLQPAPVIIDPPKAQKETWRERSATDNRLRAIKWLWCGPALLAGLAVCGWNILSAAMIFSGVEAAIAVLAAVCLSGVVLSGPIVLIYLGEREPLTPRASTNIVQPDSLTMGVRRIWVSAIVVSSIAAAVFVCGAHGQLAPTSLADKEAELSQLYRLGYYTPDELSYRLYGASSAFQSKMRARTARVLELQRDIDYEARHPGGRATHAAQMAAGTMRSMGEIVILTVLCFLLLRMASYGLATTLEAETIISAPRLAPPITLAPIEAPALLGRADRPLFVMADDVVEQPLDWLWPNVAERGEYTVIGGLPGAGKSTIVTDIAAIVSSGGQWPDGSPAQPGACILFELEDRRDSVTKPRLRAAGANFGSIAFGERLDLSTEIGKLDAMAEHMATMPGMPPLRLVSISPMIRFFGDKITTDSNTAQGKLDPLIDFAQRRKVAIIGVAHLKPNGPKEEYAGSKAFARASRANWSAIVNDADPQPDEKKKQRIFYPAKVSHAPEEELYYRLKTVQMPGGLTAARVVWETESAGKWSPSAAGKGSRKRMNGGALH